MDILLVIAVLLVLVAILGFSGMVAVLRSAAWLILVIGLLILALSFVI